MAAYSSQSLVGWRGAEQTWPPALKLALFEKCVEPSVSG